jgi:hypothetical protein
MVGDMLTFLASTDALHNDKYFSTSHLGTALSKLLQRHESRLVVQWLSADLSGLFIFQQTDMTVLVPFWKNFDIQWCDGAWKDTSISVGDICSPDYNKLPDP